MAWGEEEPAHPRDTGDGLPWKQKQRMEVEGEGSSSSPQRDAVPVPWANRWGWAGEVLERYHLSRRVPVPCVVVFSENQVTGER